MMVPSVPHPLCDGKPVSSRRASRICEADTIGQILSVVAPRSEDNPTIPDCGTNSKTCYRSVCASNSPLAASTAAKLSHCELL